MSDQPSLGSETQECQTAREGESRLDWAQQLSAVRSALLTSYLPAFLALAGVAVVSRLTRFPLGYFTRDPAQLLEGQWYVGALSNLGCLLWAAGATVCLFSWAVLRAQGRAAETRLALLGAGLLTVWLCLDDIYLFHERVLPGRLHLPEKVVFSIYLLTMAYGLIRFRSVILRADFSLLLIAAALFVGSTLSDLTGFPAFGHYLVEDGLKFVGIVSWLTFLSRLSYQQLTLPVAAAPNGGYSP